MFYRLLGGLAIAALWIFGTGSEVVETAPPKCGVGNRPPCPPPGDPPACFPMAPNTSFGAHIVEIESPTEDVSMFGRPIAAAPVAEDLVLAVGARTAHIYIYYLDFDPAQPSAPPVVSQMADVSVGDNARKLVAADFNGDAYPDFVVAGFGPVEVIMSAGMSYPTAPTSELHPVGDGIDATDEYIAVGVKGGNKDFGEVHIFTVSDGNSVVIGTNEKGGKFGEGVAFGDVLGNSDLDLIVGAPGIDKVGGRKKDTDYGMAFAYQGDASNGSFAPPPSAFAVGQAKEEDLGWQVAVAGQAVYVATKWSGSDRRVDVYSPGPTSLDRTLRPSASPAGMGDGWASGGIFTGDVGGTPSVLIGAPNANCAGEGSSGAAYLFVGGATTPEVFVPPVPVDASGNTWNAFGWSAAIVTAGVFDYVIIGEPGREYPSGDDREGKVYVYQRP